MFKKSIVTLISTAIVAVFLVSNVSASEVGVDSSKISPKQEVNATSNLAVEGRSFTPTSGPITILDRRLFTLSHTGYDAFSRSFTLQPEDGEDLNIWVKNNHRSKTVYFRVERTDNGQDFGDRKLGPGDQLTRTFDMKNGNGLQGTWRVYVYTKDGHNMDIDVSARQY
ncbi:hypothetical protein Pryu01_01551 [Paraliobacillus ryukyuensis]|uniref:Uncharacterized protein n=1 Tax=Paraliobacillus ryukyuensis TaxID=200904 RepID=A0A366EEJ9_9BACI|nr:hypothetical protein [Paraliobacillus ryukyuensis]RBO99894.1 hypothetical protein DES48_103221 [Paraliobacillus ryukyuensis]